MEHQDYKNSETFIVKRNPLLPILFGVLLFLCITVSLALLGDLRLTAITFGLFLMLFIINFDQWRKKWTVFSFGPTGISLNRFLKTTLHFKWDEISSFTVRKNRFGAALGFRTEEKYPGGVFWVSLQGTKNKSETVAKLKQYLPEASEVIFSRKASWQVPLFLWVTAVLFSTGLVFRGASFVEVAEPEKILKIGGLHLLYIFQHQYWRYFTAIFLHPNILGVLFLGASLFLLFPLLEKSVGVFRAFFIFMVSGIVGGAASLIFSPIPLVSGSWPAMCGVLFACGGYWLNHRIQLPADFGKAILFLGFLFCFLLLLPAPGISYIACLAGVGVGVLLGALNSKKNFIVVGFLFAAAAMAAPVLLSAPTTLLVKETAKEEIVFNEFIDHYEGYEANNKNDLIQKLQSSMIPALKDSHQKISDLYVAKPTEPNRYFFELSKLRLAVLVEYAKFLSLPHPTEADESKAMSWALWVTSYRDERLGYPDPFTVDGVSYNFDGVHN